MRMPRIVRWVIETIVGGGVALATGCPHCMLLTIGTVGAVECACSHRDAPGN